MSDHHRQPGLMPLQDTGGCSQRHCYKCDGPKNRLRPGLPAKTGPLHWSPRQYDRGGQAAVRHGRYVACAHEHG